MASLRRTIQRAIARERMTEEVSGKQEGRPPRDPDYPSRIPQPVAHYDAPPRVTPTIPQRAKPREPRTQREKGAKNA